MAGQVLITISKDEQERARLLSEYKFAVDLQSKMVDAKREGVKEGAESRAIEIAKEALKEGASVNFIAKITGLEESIIKDLQKKLGVNL